MHTFTETNILKSLFICLEVHSVFFQNGKFSHTVLCRYKLVIKITAFSSLQQFKLMYVFIVIRVSLNVIMKVIILSV
jgi:hypothetical protein